MRTAEPRPLWQFRDLNSSSGLVIDVGPFDEQSRGQMGLVTLECTRWFEFGLRTQGGGGRLTEVACFCSVSWPNLPKSLRQEHPGSLCALAPVRLSCLEISSNSALELALKQFPYSYSGNYFVKVGDLKSSTTPDLIRFPEFCTGVKPVSWRSEHPCRGAHVLCILLGWARGVGENMTCEWDFQIATMSKVGKKQF